MWIHDGSEPSASRSHSLAPASSWHVARQAPAELPKPKRMEMVCQTFLLWQSPLHSASC